MAISTMSKNSHDMSSSYEGYKPEGNQAKGTQAENKILQAALLIAIISAAVCILFFTGLSAWSCFQKRKRHTFDLDLTEENSCSDDGASSNKKPSRRPSISEDKACLPVQILTSGTSDDSDESANTSPTTLYEEFDFGFPLETTDPEKKDVGEPVQQEEEAKDYGSPTISSSCPEHISFIPKPLLAGNVLLQLTPLEKSHSKPYGYHDRVMLRTLPEPLIRSSSSSAAKMSPAEASIDLQQLIEQVNLHIYEDFEEAGEDSSNLSDSITIYSNPDSPVTPTDGCFPSPPLDGLDRKAAAAAFLPLPFPRYNFRQFTRLRQPSGSSPNDLKSPENQI
ncbi:hypothetical protein Pst134EA_017377 [Puccinia striiformis f. sp. tritici]|uniref:hypothetical protein n=1 Tax=Puccinia striiformis f. sp. tritici TaxID=168172 RepID=UPI002008AB59|nr:hypothetical protein Pst134EA_017377 [Puccinia striiformis f. sp. tritici]KAH9461069.1 hypothetical protein Pst134EA_017377 [Puccinia striiformis f. sp. tritici]